MRHGFVSIIQVLNIIGLAVLSLLINSKFDSFFGKKNEYTIKYNIPGDNDEYIYSGKRSLKIAQNFNFINFQFTGNDTDDENILLMIKHEARRLSYTKDKKNIIRIHLPDNISYGRFISLLSLMQEEGHKLYFEWDNYFYIIGYAAYKTLPNNM
ncbi:MAG: hypothetical protein ABL872_12535 [Lacibacter sp.]